MGCAFSRNRVRVPRILKRKKVSRSQKHLLSTPPEVKHVSTQTTGDHLRSIYSQRPATLNNNTSTSGWYTADVAPSTLLWLAGPKDCLEDSIPELANTGKNRNNNNQESDDKEESKDFNLPPCLEYQGYHEYGYHLFTLNSSVFNNTVQDMSLDCILEAISSILGEDNKRFVLVYKNNQDKTTYLPNPPAWGTNMLEKICTRFGDDLLRVVLYRPSWYLLSVLEEQADNSCYFSLAVREKLKVTSDYKKLARLTVGYMLSASVGTAFPRSFHTAIKEGFSVFQAKSKGSHRPLTNCK